MAEDQDLLTDQDLKALQIVDQLLIVTENRVYEHVASTFRWLMATLFAGNGGSALALLNHEPHSDLTIPLTSFGLGVVLSIGMGIASAIAGQRAAAPVGAARSEVIQMLVDRVPRRTALDRLIQRYQPTWRTFIPSYIGGVSFICLIVGMIAAGPTLLS